ncbi:zinc carboxypeptidase-like [Contarinia nasturtii]|uniref:zinc carboxypeptidase-like n=1 Tax=Contarinia nasturtii TaxID=265458 RepID=UPI0012D458F9|nr:zinc carboxypeptidase-like [Contarinia nasturtii]
MRAVLITFFISFTYILCEKARFDYYRVYSIEIENDDQLQVMQDLENHQDGLLFLTLPIANQTMVDILVPPHKFSDIGELFQKYEMKNKIKIENLQSLIDEEQSDGASSRAAFGWNRYNTLKEINDWMDEMLRQYPSVLTNYDIGRSYEKRTIRALKLSTRPELKNPIIFVESTVHAREWITAATATYLLNALLTASVSRPQDPEITPLAMNYDWVFVPVVNPDGYVYSHTNNRMWRKNRRPQSNWCVGVDGNRNFGFYHAQSGGSKDPCSELYGGAKAFSEPETFALSEFVKNFNISLYLSFHSYGQMLLFPYGHSKKRSGNYKDLMEIGLKSAQAIKKRFGTIYEVGPTSEVLYIASGTSADWVYAKRNVSLSYIFEFRDVRNGRNGFILPPKQIIPNALEVIDGLKVMIKEANLRGYL